MTDFIKLYRIDKQEYTLINIKHIIEILGHKSGCTIYLDDNGFGIDVKESIEQIEKILILYV